MYKVTNGLRFPGVRVAAGGAPVCHGLVAERSILDTLPDPWDLSSTAIARRREVR